MTRADSPLVSAAWLAERLGAPGVRVIEVASANDAAGYREGHVPGAVWWYWKAALWHDTDREFPAPETMGGHPDVRLLDGAKTRWRADGRPLATEAPPVTPVPYRPRPGDTASRVGRDDVRAGLGRPGRLLLDARSLEEYRGERVMPPPFFDHGAERTGRIPGAVHLYYRELLNADDTFKRPEELRAVLLARGASADRGDIVAYCRLSHRAALAWFAMRHLLGYKNVRVYDGSWTEWGSIVGFPVEK